MSVIDRIIADYETELAQYVTVQINQRWVAFKETMIVGEQGSIFYISAESQYLLDVQVRRRVLECVLHLQEAHISSEPIATLKIESMRTNEKKGDRRVYIVSQDVRERKLAIGPSVHAYVAEAKDETTSTASDAEADEADDRYVDDDHN